ncbi:hypothetical protein [Phaeacidiphilus oryzae]|jgi:hypothetical protein|uniref:hypothetical protein n=1 Tax=Phaeacidiphilus oryzae TaxID=348818 RepID=UPI00056B012B|nr:hypothetical protein [Phaeacidiphilus oryzae]
MTSDRPTPRPPLHKLFAVSRELADTLELWAEVAGTRTVGPGARLIVQFDRAATLGTPTLVMATIPLGHEAAAQLTAVVRQGLDQLG